MIPVTSLRAGTTFEDNGEIFEVVSYEHIKMGRGSANVKLRVKNLRNGSTIEKGYISNNQVRDIQLEKRDFQFLYKDAEFCCLMDPQSFDQQMIPVTKLDGYEYLKEGETASIRFYNDEPLGLLLPPKVTFTIKETPPGVKGDSASNVYKDAILENGVRIKVPLFVNEGDRVIVDTRDNTYTKRA